MRTGKAEEFELFPRRSSAADAVYEPYASELIGRAGPLLLVLLGDAAALHDGRLQNQSRRDADRRQNTIPPDARCVPKQILF